MTFFEAHVVVDVHHLSGGHVDEDVVKVTVAEADDVTHHRHDGGGPRVGLRGTRERRLNMLPSPR